MRTSLLFLVLAAGLLLFVPEKTWAATACDDPKTPNGLFVFSEKNCPTPNLIAPAPITQDQATWSQKIKSFRIEGAQAVFFYEEAEYNGRSVCFNGISGMADYHGYIDDVASIRTPRGTNECTNPGVVVGCGGSLLGKLVCEVSHIGPTITNAGINMAAGVVSTIVEAVIMPVVTFVFLGVTKAFMLVINHFLGTTVVPDGATTPGFVTTAWDSVRTLVNMFFILILVFIGLATILRIPNYQYQKTLPLLIIMALLVNFSGVFVGFVVDMPNLLARYFLDRASGDWKQVTDLSFVDLRTQGMAQLATQLATILYYIFAILIFFVLMLVFLVRSMVLWVAVILAPLAFASYILPATRGWLWNEWLKQLLQWSFFVIPATFFLWVSKLALTGVSKAVPPASDNVSWLVSGLAPFTALFILYLGVMKSQEMAPAAAKGVIDFGKKWGGNIGFGAGTAAWRKFGRPVERFAGNIRKRAEGAEVPEVRRTVLEKWIGEKGINRFTRSRLGKLAKPLATALEIGGAEVSSRVGQRDRREYAEHLQSFQGMSSDNIINAIREENLKPRIPVIGLRVGRNINRIAAAMGAMDTRGDQDDIHDAQVDKRLPDERVGEAFQHAYQNLGTPYYRLLGKGELHHMLTNPEAFGFKSGFVEEDDPQHPGQKRIARDDYGDPKYKDQRLEALKSELIEKLSLTDIQNEILGNAITRGRPDADMLMGPEFGNLPAYQFFLRRISRQKGGQFLDPLIRRPKSAEGRQAMAESLNQLVDEMIVELDALPIDILRQRIPVLKSMLRYLIGTAAQNQGVGLDARLPNDPTSGKEYEVDAYIKNLQGRLSGTPATTTATQPTGTPPSPGWTWNGTMWVPPPRRQRHAPQSYGAPSTQQPPPTTPSAPPGNIFRQQQKSGPQQPSVKPGDIFRQEKKKKK